MAAKKWKPKPGSLTPDVADLEEIERPTKPHDPDSPEHGQDLGSDLDGFLFPGHHRVSGGWDGPDD